MGAFALFSEILPKQPVVYALIVASVALIYLAYRFLENEWPEVYFSTTNKSSAIIAANPIWYFSFRFFPVFVITALVLSFYKSEDFADSNRSFAGLLVGLMHVSMTDVVALAKILYRTETIHNYLNRSGQIMVHVGSILLVLILSIAGGYVSSFSIVQNATPEVQGVVDNIWSAFIIAVFVSFFPRLIIKLHEILSANDPYEQSRIRIPKEIFNEIEKQANSYRANVYLVKAVCIVENLQRPKWVRNVERIKSFFYPLGTYGIMQVSGDQYISDIESVKFAVEKFFKNSADISDENELALIVGKYNKNPTYVGMVSEVYRSLLPPQQY